MDIEDLDGSWNCRDREFFDIEDLDWGWNYWDIIFGFFVLGGFYIIWYLVFFNLEKNLI